MKWIAPSTFCLVLLVARAAGASPSTFVGIDQIGEARTSQAASLVGQIDMQTVAAPPNVTEVTNNPTDTVSNEQIGVAQTEIVTQLGQNDASSVSQSGEFEFARVKQQGSDDVSTIEQSGRGNQALVTQMSDGARSTIVQTGFANVAVVRQ